MTKLPELHPSNAEYKLCIGIVLLVLAAISACQSPPTTPNEPSATIRNSPVPPSTASEPANTLFPSSMPTRELALTPTSTRTPTSVLTPSAPPTVITYAPLSLVNIRQLTKIGRPFQTTKYGHLSYPVSRYVQMIFRPEGTWVAEEQLVQGTLLDEHHIRVSDINGTLIKTLVDEPHKKDTGIDAIIASPDGHFLAGIDVEAEHVVVWDMDTLEKEVLFDLHHYASYKSAPGYVPLAGSFSDDGKYLAVAGCRYMGSTCLNAGVNVYDMTTNRLVKEISFVQGRTSDVAFQPGTSHLIVAGSGEAKKNVDLLVWDVEKDQKVAEVTLENAGVWGKIAFDSTGNIFAAELFYTKEQENRISFWDTQTWTIYHEINIKHGHSCDFYVFVPSTQMLAYSCSYEAGDPGHEWLLLVGPGDTAPILELYTGLGRIGNIFVSPDGSFIYTFDLVGFLTSRQKVVPAHIQRWGVPSVSNSTP